MWQPRAYEAALREVGLGISPRSVEAVGNDPAGPLLPKAPASRLSHSSAEAETLVCLGAFDTRGSTVAHCLREAEGVW